LSRFHPQYKLTNLPPTPVETLDRARDIALEEGIDFAYVGNVPGHPGNNTYCPSCGELLIERQGFTVTAYHLKGGTCGFCEETIPGVWWPSHPEGEPVQVSPGPADQ
jgi:pyruvate formate lyase activating enzyme